MRRVADSDRRLDTRHKMARPNTRHRMVKLKTPTTTTPAPLQIREGTARHVIDHRLHAEDTEDE